MTSRDFVYWLQGYFELADCLEGGADCNGKQMQIIKNHLNMVFKHEIDPSMGSTSHQLELNNLHNTTKPFVPGESLVRC